MKVNNINVIVGIIIIIPIIITINNNVCDTAAQICLE